MLSKTKTDFKQSKTYKNLEATLQGEAMAHIRYQIYAALIGETSKKFEAEILEIAHNEKEHWKVFAKLLYGEDYYNNLKNLETAITGETEECLKKYDKFALTAKKEGFNEISEKFELIADIECSHSTQFKNIKEKIEHPNDYPTSIWICSNCGHMTTGAKIPDKCPVCDHPKQYFK